MKTIWIVLFSVAAATLAAVGCGASSYNNLVRLDQAAQSQWAQVENVYQRRLDLIPNLVATVKGAAAFEKDTFTAVTEARSRAAQLTAASQRAPADTESLQRFQRAQDELGSTLSKLMLVVEGYPELRATQNFRDLQAQLEGTENRITVERMRFNEAAQAFNTARDSLPATLFANLFGARFREKPYFQAAPGSEVAPKVAF
ncbi:MAG TPA: LemA family protein [Polyangiaceae bacterium]|nr:LemA family protein [Polyangiaceae bacterium]